MKQINAHKFYFYYLSLMAINEYISKISNLVLDNANNIIMKNGTS